MTVYVKYGNHAAISKFHQDFSAGRKGRLLLASCYHDYPTELYLPVLSESAVLKQEQPLSIAQTKRGVAIEGLEHRQDLTDYVDMLCAVSDITPCQLILLPFCEGKLELTLQQHIVSDLTKLFPSQDFILTTMSPVVVASSPRQNVRWLDWCKGDEIDELFEREVPFAAGATLERVLIELFALPERVPSAMTDVVSEYGRTQSPEALALIERELGWDQVIGRVDADNTRKRLLRDWSNRNAASFHVDQLFSSWVTATCPGAVSVVRHRNIYQFRDYDNPVRLLTNAECRAYEAFCALWNEAARLQGE